MVNTVYSCDICGCELSSGTLGVRIFFLDDKGKTFIFKPVYDTNASPKIICKPCQNRIAELNK